jgi:tetratricopeptide (TPR) repeat protein
VRIGNQAGQASTLGQLGILYDVVLQRPEAAVAFKRQAAESYREIGESANEGAAQNNLANSFRKLQRLEVARQAIRRAIECKALFDNAASPWTSWAFLADIENATGKSAAAADARYQALGTFPAYRRDDGENQSGSGRLALAVRQTLASDDPDEVATSLQQLTAYPAWARHFAFFTARQATTACSRGRSLDKEPWVDYQEAAEVLLLIEALEAEAGGCKPCLPRSIQCGQI